MLFAGGLPLEESFRQQFEVNFRSSNHQEVLPSYLGVKEAEICLVVNGRHIEIIDGKVCNGNLNAFMKSIDLLCRTIHFVGGGQRLTSVTLSWLPLWKMIKGQLRFMSGF